MSAPRAYSHLALLARHASDSLVAFGQKGDRSARDLRVDAARIARALPEPSDDSHVLLVFERDRYAMAAALLGSLARGHAIALAPNSRRDSILAIEGRPTTVAVAHDTDAGIEIDVPALLSIPGASPDSTPNAEASIELPFAAPRSLMATVFTSGSTGPMTGWRKSSAELLGEALGLARTFGIGPGDRIVATVPAGHIYGLLFSVLLPLTSGAAFFRETPHHAAAVAQAVRQYRATILASVPVHLRALAASKRGTLDSVRRVFSSTGPLPENVALGFAEQHGRAITEILGSTETGGIAHRRRQRSPRDGHRTDATEPATEDAWRPFEEVQISVADSGHLCVDSPYLHADLPRPFRTGDLVDLREDGCFEHRGRADGIVKIGGHRVAVFEVEERLRDCDGVEDAAVVAIPAEGARGHQLLAVVAPADVEPAALRERLLERFEPTCLPRRIRCVERLPREANGKLQREKLLRLFGLDAQGSPGSMSLAWSEPVRAKEDDRVRFERAVRVPLDYGWFLGHFDGYPVLAGAVQLKELVLPTVEAAFPELGPTRSLGRVKFNGRIVPGDELVVRVVRRDIRPIVGFEIERKGMTCTSGTITLGNVGNVDDIGEAGSEVR